MNKRVSSSKLPRPALHFTHSSPRTFFESCSWSTHHDPCFAGVVVLQIAQHPPCAATIASYVSTVRPYFRRRYFFMAPGLRFFHALPAALKRSRLALRHASVEARFWGLLAASHAAFDAAFFSGLASAHL